MKRLDEQLLPFASRLQSEVALTLEETLKVSVSVASDVRLLTPESKSLIAAASPVPLGRRVEELLAFQKWSDMAAAAKDNAPVVRASVIVQNYICFVYLKDACFEIIGRVAPAGSVASRVCRFLSTGRVRDFRNAFSHANWTYSADWSGLECWVLEDGRNKAGPMRQFVVSQNDLDFWQALSRATAYSIYSDLA